MCIDLHCFLQSLFVLFSIMSIRPQSEVVIFAGETIESHRLADLVCSHLEINKSKCKVARFNDDESQPQFGVSVANKIVVLVSCLHQTSQRNSNDNMMVLFQMCRAAFASQAEQIVVVSPYMPMARQDKPDDKRSCIGAGLFPDLLRAAAKTTPIRFITFDLHAAQISTVFQNSGVLSDNNHTEPHIISYCKEWMKENKISNNDIVVVGPDAGAVKRAKRVASDGYGLSCGFAFMDKTRRCAGEVASVQLVGDVTGKYCIVVDDMCDTGGTINRAASELISRGATGVTILVCHGVFSKDALDKLSGNKDISQVVFTNTCDKNYALEPYRTVGEHDNIRYAQLAEHPKFQMIDISWLLAETVKRRAISGGSVSELFDTKATSEKHLRYIQQQPREEISCLDA